jgi:hypothetical protein
MAITIKSFTLPVNMTMSETAMLFQTLRNIALYYEAEVKLEATKVVISAPGLYFRAIDRMMMDCI